MVPHPSTLPKWPMSVHGIVETKGAHEIALTYDVTGETDKVRWPALSKSQFRRELWTSTCFELFVGIPNTENYLEFNFSPSTEWCGFSFRSYRNGRSDLRDLAFSRFDVTRTESSVSIHAQFEIPETLLNFENSEYRSALSAVIEDTDGQLSYWADTHRSDVPDFHNNQSFERLLTPRKDPR